MTCTRRALLAATLASAALLGACTNLGEIELAQCGNGIVELESREECDSFPDDGGCRPPGAVGECRFDCSVQEDGSQRFCPTGMGCGTDGICRQHSGAFEPKAASGAASVRVLAGDLDGDRLDDLISVGKNGITISYFDSGGSVSKSSGFGFPPTLPVIAHMTNDTINDMVVVREGLSVFRGRSNRALLPTAYAPFEISAVGDAKALIMEAMPFEGGIAGSFLGDEVLFLVDNSLVGVDTNTVGRVVDLPVHFSQIAGDVQVGQIIEDAQLSPCDELVLAPKGEDWVWIYSPCLWDSGNQRYVWNQDNQNTNPIMALPRVQLPPGRQIKKGAILADVNVDGHLDLIIGTEPSTACAAVDPTDVFLTYGVGDGTFHSDPATIPATDGDGRAVLIDLGFACAMPLAVGDLNLDGLADIVSPGGILISVPLPGGLTPPLAQGSFSLSVINFGNPWTEAVIADFNGNGLPDVAAVSDQLRVDFYNGTGDLLLNRFTIPTAGQPSDLVVGDFDGDLIGDLAFRQLGPTGNVPVGVEVGDALSIAFGRPLGSLEDPISMGRLSRIQQIEPGVIPGFANDLVSDLLVVSKQIGGEATSLAILPGSGDRQLLSPFLFSREETEEVPVRVAVGQFDGDEGDHQDIAVLTSDEPEGLGLDIIDFKSKENLWMLPSTGEAAIDAGAVTRSMQLPNEFFAEQALLAPLDLDDDGIDEVVVLGPHLNGEELGSMMVMRVGNGPEGLGFVGDSLQLLEEGYWFEDVGASVGGEGDQGGRPMVATSEVSALDFYNGHLVLGDVDVNGHDDIVALAIGVDEGTQDIATQIVVFPNHGTGSMEVHDRVIFQNPPGIAPTSFGLVNADSDPEVEIAILGPDGAWLADFDIDAGAFVNVQKLGVRGGLSLAVGDFNGDGIKDLAVTAADAPTVFLGIPVLR